MAVEQIQGQVSEQTRLFERARLELARLHASGGVSLRDVWLQLADLVANALEVDRVGVWVLIDEGRAIRCRYLLQRSSKDVFQGAVLRAQDFPEYFDALRARRTLPAADAQTSGLTRELRESYLQPLNITSMLDAPIYLEGRVVGVVCHEHIGPQRNWSGAESDFASAVADNIARLYTNVRTRRPRYMPTSGTSWNCIAWRRWVASRRASRTTSAACSARRWVTRN